MRMSCSDKLRELAIRQLEITFELEDIFNNLYESGVVGVNLSEAYKKSCEAFEALRSSREQEATDAIRRI